MMNNTLYMSASAFPLSSSRILIFPFLLDHFSPVAILAILYKRVPFSPFLTFFNSGKDEMVCLVILAILCQKVPVSPLVRAAVLPSITWPRPQEKLESIPWYVTVCSFVMFLINYLAKIGSSNVQELVKLFL